MSMELKIEWTEIGAAGVMSYQPYFVTNAPEKDAVITAFCIAYWLGGHWVSPDNTPMSIKVTHVCRIGKSYHTFLPCVYAMEDKVEILACIDEYEKGSIGKIVGKYDMAKTWCIRMENNFVILLEEKRFRHCYPGGENA